MFAVSCRYEYETETTRGYTVQQYGVRGRTKRNKTFKTFPTSQMSIIKTRLSYNMYSNVNLFYTDLGGTRTGALCQRVLAVDALSQTAVYLC